MKDLTDYLQSSIEYHENQNLLISNQDHITAADYKWMAANNAQVAELKKWIRMLDNLPLTTPLQGA